MAPVTQGIDAEIMQPFRPMHPRLVARSLVSPRLQPGGIHITCSRFHSCNSGRGRMARECVGSALDRRRQSGRAHTEFVPDRRDEARVSFETGRVRNLGQIHSIVTYQHARRRHPHAPMRIHVRNGALSRRSNRRGADVRRSSIVVFVRDLCRPAACNSDTWFGRAVRTPWVDPPRARIVVATDPAVLPPSGTRPQFGLLASDADIMRKVQAARAASTGRIAEQESVTVIDMTAVGVDHSTCSLTPWTRGRDRWTKLGSTRTSQGPQLPRRRSSQGSPSPARLEDRHGRITGSAVRPSGRKRPLVGRHAEKLFAGWRHRILAAGTLDGNPM